MPKPKVTFFIDQKMLKELKKLSEITRVKQSDYIREGIEIVLEKYKGIAKAMKEGRYPTDYELPIDTTQIIRTSEEKYTGAKKGGEIKKGKRSF
ncbi:MAG: ribbon-helix-helix domain-containing protein [Deltaproteobacteria bacterium]|nr:ribbon-helix-helix domain-containing protein [Deltaproteobacteria bacterium]